MNKPLRNKALAVGILAAVCGVAFLVAFTFFKKGGYSEKESYLVYAYFDDATGLTWKSRVQIAGIQVGEVEAVTLAGGRGRLDLRIRRDIPLRLDACVTKRFPSTLLPDAVLEASLGSGGLPLLRDLPEKDREVKCVREAASVAKLLESVSKITVDLQTVSSGLAETVTGTRGSIRQIIENLSSISRNIDTAVAENGRTVGQILDNANAVSADLRHVTNADRDKYMAIAKNLQDASEQLKQVLASVQGILGNQGVVAQVGGSPGANQGGANQAGAPAAAQAEAKEQMKGVAQALAKVNDSLENVKQISAKVAEGEGVAGKLLVDERLGRKLGSAIEGASDYVDRLTRLKLEVGMRSEWLLNERGSKTYFGLKIMPRPDKYYLVELINDPRGYKSVVNTTTTTETQDAAGNRIGYQTTIASATTQDIQRVLFSLEFAKRFGPATFRIGIIESSGGAGADLHLLDDALRISVNLYQFSRPDQSVLPRAKLWADYNVFQHLYLTAGSDDFLNAWRAGHYPGGPKFTIGSDVFFGAGLFFTDDDLKALLGSFGSAAGAAAGGR
ncbi:MAG TPA: MlaD family protein [Anaeromyxobacteraceae bacterium]|jgi:phospholipid/cholesterol/gamma-HCH transport system substrate-binding protein|nr:MlaD family protein [Anaeromyxobacteraceae bacterium]